MRFLFILMAILWASSPACATFDISALKAHGLFPRSLRLAGPLDWNVGERLYSDLDLGNAQAPSATLDIYVDHVTETELWLYSEFFVAPFTFLPVLSKYEKATGKLLAVFVYGEEQEPAETQYEVLETSEEFVRVPAGDFFALCELRRELTEEQLLYRSCHSPELPLDGTVYNEVLGENASRRLLRLYSFGAGAR